MLVIVVAVSNQLLLRRAKHLVKTTEFYWWLQDYLYIYERERESQLVYLSHSEVDIRYSLIFSSVTGNGKTYKSELSYQNTVWKLLFIKPFPCLGESKHSEAATSWFQAKIIPSATSYTVCLERSNVVKRKNVLRFYKRNTTLFFGLHCFFGS